MPRKDSPSPNGVAAMNPNLTTPVKILIQRLSRIVSNAASSVITPMPRGNGATPMNRTTCAWLLQQKRLYVKSARLGLRRTRWLQLKSKSRRHEDLLPMDASHHLFAAPQVSKYWSCSCILVFLYSCILVLFISNKQKRKQKGKIRVSEAVVVLGQEKQKK